LPTKNVLVGPMPGTKTNHEPAIPVYFVTSSASRRPLISPRSGFAPKHGKHDLRSWPRSALTPLTARISMPRCAASREIWLLSDPMAGKGSSRPLLNPPPTSLRSIPGCRAWESHCPHGVLRRRKLWIHKMIRVAGCTRRAWRATVFRPFPAGETSPPRPPLSAPGAAAHARRKRPRRRGRADAAPVASI